MLFGGASSPGMNFQFIVIYYSYYNWRRLSPCPTLGRWLVTQITFSTYDMRHKRHDGPGLGICLSLIYFILYFHYMSSLCHLLYAVLMERLLVRAKVKLYPKQRKLQITVKCLKLKSEHQCFLLSTYLNVHCFVCLHILHLISCYISKRHAQ